MNTGYVEEVLDAWVTEPTIVVTPTISGDMTPVVRIDSDGYPEFWGVLRRINGQVVFGREQKPWES